jgi:hypothetical protein
MLKNAYICSRRNSPICMRCHLESNACVQSRSSQITRKMEQMLASLQQVPRRVVPPDHAIPYRTHEENRPFATQSSRTHPELLPRSKATFQRRRGGPEQQRSRPMNGGRPGGTGISQQSEQSAGAGVLSRHAILLLFELHSKCSRRSLHPAAVDNDGPRFTDSAETFGTPRCCTCSTAGSLSPGRVGRQSRCWPGNPADL